MHKMNTLNSRQFESYLFAPKGALFNSKISAILPNTAIFGSHKLPD